MRAIVGCSFDVKVKRSWDQCKALVALTLTLSLELSGSRALMLWGKKCPCELQLYIIILYHMIVLYCEHKISEELLR